MTILNLFLLIISQIQQALADVNMLDASFFKNWTDYHLSRDRREFKLQRAYRSRSLHNGFFGFGWCTDLEKKLVTKDDKKLQIEKCSTIEATYLPRENNFVSFNNYKDEIVFTKNQYIRKLNNRPVEVYDKSGRLLSVSHQDILAYTLFYPNTKMIPTEILLETGVRLKLLWNQKNKISQIKIAELTFIYQYEDDDLTVVTKNSLPLYEYEYDNTHNLIFAKTNQTWIKLSYDIKEDQVLSLVSSDGCKEVYSYTHKLISPLESRQLSHATKICQEQIIHSKQFEFVFERSMNTLATLTRMKFTSGSTIVNFLPKKRGKYFEVSEFRSPSQSTQINSKKGGSIAESHNPN